VWHKKENNMSFYKELLKFLAQAEKENDLTTKSFIKEYKNLDVKVSFGQGNPAKIPWISFLLPPNKTSQGIYPVYLYFKDKSILILAYGISETEKPQYNWNIQNGITINKYFNNKVFVNLKGLGADLWFKDFKLGI
jgi:5-methylcytosine-specific restriction protein B